VRQPIEAKAGSVTRYDSEYERNGVSNLCLFFEPLAGWRKVTVTDHRTAIDWAYQIQALVDHHYSEAEKITRVMANLNTHVGASRYNAFPPEEARRIVGKLALHYTPKQGSWLNRTEIELRILSRQCLHRRRSAQHTLKKEVNTGAEKRKQNSSPMNWRFTTEDARIKLKRLYPKIDD